MIPILLFLAASATAGPLADGFRGLAFGPASALAVAPLESCVADPRPGVRWACDAEINGAPVLVCYHVDRGCSSRSRSARTATIDTSGSAER